MNQDYKNIQQDTIKVLLPPGATTSSAKRQVLGGNIRQIQAFTNNVDASIFVEIAINDVSGNPIVRRQPFDNLKSRNGNYFSNLPIHARGGLEYEVVIYVSGSFETETYYAVVFDIENNNC
jgi:hypothetical protein